MGSISQFAAAARGQSVVQQHPILPDTNSPGVAVSALFQFQSYFDTTLLENALLTQSTNEPIVGSTLRQEQLGGYAVGLHPSSQTPVAFQPLVGGQSASPQAVILRPGQIYRPHGKPGSGAGNFSGFRWGLPFGWLGGGVATLYVFPSHDAEVHWPGASPEIIFHRQTMQILAPASLAGQANANKNWPLRFPWTQALRGATNISQAGAAIVGIAKPTRIELSLRLASLAAPADMRVLIQSSNDFDLDSAGAIVATPVRFIDLTWGSYGANGGAGNLGTNYPLMEVTNGVWTRMAADDGGVQLVDISASTLTNAFVDVCRYGEL